MTVRDQAGRFRVIAKLVDVGFVDEPVVDIELTPLNLYGLSR
jgi:hypothetical protein